jgi:hypothetical protein
MSKEIYFYDASDVRRRVKEFYFYDGSDVRRKVKEAYFYDGSGVRRQFFASAPPNVLSGTMTAGTSSNFVGFSKSPASPVFGSCSPIPSIGNYTLCYCASISINAELECAFAGATDPGAAGLFTTFNDGLGNARLASSAVYVWNNTSGIARWRFTTAAVDYVNATSYNLSFVV